MKKHIMFSTLLAVLSAVLLITFINRGITMETKKSLPEKGAGISTEIQVQREGVQRVPESQIISEKVTMIQPTVLDFNVPNPCHVLANSESDVRQFAISQDGLYVAYMVGGPHIYRQDVVSPTVKSHLGSGSRPRISDDGNRVVYTLPDGQFRLWDNTANMLYYGIDTACGFATFGPRGCFDISHDGQDIIYLPESGKAKLLSIQPHLGSVLLKEYAEVPFCYDNNASSLSSGNVVYSNPVNRQVLFGANTGTQGGIFRADFGNCASLILPGGYGGVDASGQNIVYVSNGMVILFNVMTNISNSIGPVDVTVDEEPSINGNYISFVELISLVGGGPKIRLHSLFTGRNFDLINDFATKPPLLFVKDAMISSDGSRAFFLGSDGAAFELYVCELPSYW